ncbi:unnamed protein product [Sphagnum balticum]
MPSAVTTVEDAAHARLPQEGIIGNRVSRLYHRQRQSSNIQSPPTILPDGRNLSLAVQISVGSSGRPW